MHLKNILFFCVSLCFFHCQGVPPTDEQLNEIKQLIRSHLGEDDLMDFEQLLVILSEVGNIVGQRMNIPSVEDIKIKLSLTNDEVEISMLSYISRAKPITNYYITRLIAETMGENGFMDFATFMSVCRRVADVFGISKEILSIDIFQKYITPNMVFSMSKAVVYALAYASTQNPEVHEAVRDVIETYENHDLKQYEDFNIIFNRVRERTPLHMPCPTYEEFDKEYKKTRLSKESVLQIVFNTYFDD
ncbi:uncharacterized protein LOC126839129 [Adelges cooleyi]|uniref:uncharacterized protein LOC126839129 n=1 Tax=Adelges cooleyi TaxID=133065 RepID=UPI00217F6A1E|nr:uncharacterized protein LOC126839129 [Adelges cooleyi]